MVIMLYNGSLNRGITPVEMKKLETEATTKEY